MEQFIICNDINYIAQQPPSKITLIVGQMTSLLESISDLKRSTDNRVERLQNQSWFKRMWNTITGKNKATKEEIRRNQDKIVGYISESVAQLYKMDLIEMQVMQSLSNRINQVYAQLIEVYNEQLQMKAQIADMQEMKAQIVELHEIQQQTIRSLGEIANTLDEKIESIDNFHLLIKEIEQGKYPSKNQLLSICCILAQLDRRTTEDERKMNILKEALIQSGLISKKPVSLRDILMEIISLSDDKIGTVYLELSNYSDSFPVNIFIDVIETFHSPTDTDNLSKKKKVLIQSIIEKYNLESNKKLLYSDIFENLIRYKENSFVDLNSLSLKICQINQHECIMQMFKEKIIPCIKSSIYCALGYMLYYGQGVSQDYAQAAEWYRKSCRTRKYFST